MQYLNRAKRRAVVCLFAMIFSCAFANADQHDQSDQSGTCNDNEDQLPAGTSEVTFTDKKGNRWTDLHIVIRSSLCYPRSPVIDLQTLKNAKLTCKAKGGRLPKLSEVNELATWISSKYLHGLETGVPETIDARFMHELRHFWTATLEQEGDRFVFNRALARVSTLPGSVDMSKADVIYRPALQDDRLRPFLCIFPADETSDVVVVVMDD